MKKVSGTLRLDLAQYRELAAFSQFASDLDEATRKQLERGERLVELLKQAQYSPYDVEDQVISIFAGTKGFLDTVEKAKVIEAERGLLEHIKTKHGDLRDAIRNEKQISAENEAKLNEVISSFISNNY